MNTEPNKQVNRQTDSTHKSESRQPVFFISHGGGPWPWLKEEMPFFDELEDFLQKLPAMLPERPKAILSVSAHWIEKEFTVMNSAQPGMLYDYYGFPDHTYQVNYPAPGAPEFAARVSELLTGSGIVTREDAQRPFDHGTYVPLYVSWPDADIPVFQLSLKAPLDPAEHINTGKALAPLRNEGVLIIGSGLSFHNLSIIFNTAAAAAPSQQFDRWLQQAVAATADTRLRELVEWERAPAARTAHPAEDHLLPLMVAAGAALNDDSQLVHHEQFMGGIAVSSFRFG